MAYKLRSIDVWDTLLRRDCHPESIKLAIAQHVYLQHRDVFASRQMHVQDLYQARLDVERELGQAAHARGHDDEYTLEAVFEYWIGRVLPVGVAVTPLVQALAHLELEMETRRSSVDPLILQFLAQYPAAQTVYLSDFYMRGPMLHSLLVRKGLDAVVPAGLVSCDIGLNKRSGRLFRHLHGLHSVTPAEHVHIGDNLWSDVEAARKEGVEAVHYVPEELHAQRLAREALFASRSALFAALREEVVTSTVTVTPGRTREQAAAFLIGAEAAPLFVGFALWLAEESIARGLDGLCFLTREGEFFHRVFTALFPGRSLVGHALAPTCVLELSRLATFAGSLPSASIADVGRMWTLFGTQHVEGLLRTLGLDPSGLAEPLAAAGLTLNERLEQPASDPRLARLFESPAFQNALNAAIARQRAPLSSYLAARGVVAGQRVGIVDVGWRGTIQDHLALLLPDTELHGFYLGLRRFVNPQPANVRKASYGPDENLEGAIDPLFESFAMLEMLCMAPGGSVVGFEQDAAGAVVPVRQPLADEDAVLAGFVAGFQEGVLHAAAHWRQAVERHALTAQDLRPLALQIWAGLHRQPDQDLLQAFMQAPQQDLFGFGDVFHRNRVPSLGTVVLAPVVPARRRELTDFVRRVQWPAAVAGYRELGWLHRSALTTVFHLANGLRRMRSRIRYRR